MLDVSGVRLRAAFFRTVRHFFEEQGFLEVDTPLRLPTCIPETHIVPIEVDGYYLQASPELCMKRLLSLGCERIFQICPCFRKGEKGQLHSEEFKILEWYRLEADYFQLMQDCQALVHAIVVSLSSYDFSPFYGLKLDGQWPRLSVADAFLQYSPVGLEESLVDGSFDQILVEYIEPHLGREAPLFLYNYPVALGSLARVSANDPRWAERFELYMHGVEVANGFSELADPVEQRQRFATEIKEISNIYGRDVSMPERFLAELSKMGDAAGIALGLDRLLMLAINGKSVAEVQTFAVGEDFL